MITTHLDPSAQNVHPNLSSTMPASRDASDNAISHPSLGPGEIRALSTDGQLDHDADVDDGDPRHTVTT
jgi:hypothetical protein